MSDQELANNYPVSPSDCFRIVISELHAADACEVSVKCMGKPMPVYHVVGLLEQAKLDILNSAVEGGSVYLDAE